MRIIHAYERRSRRYVHLHLNQTEWNPNRVGFFRLSWLLFAKSNNTQKKQWSINTKFYLPLFPKISFDFCFIQNLVTVCRCLIPLNNWFQYTFFSIVLINPIWILVNFYFCNRTVLDLICFTFATHIWEILMHRIQCTNWTTMHKQRNKKRYRNSRINNSNSSSYVKTHRAMTENTPSHTKTNTTTDIVASMLSNTVLTVICLPAACFLLLARDESILSFYLTFSVIHGILCMCCTQLHC